MSYYIKQDGSYYEGDKEHALDAVVPQRPSALHTFDGAEWVLSKEAAKTAHNAPLDEQLKQLDGQYALTQRNLRDLVVILSDALKSLGVDMTVLKGYKVAKAVEVQAEALRQQRQ